MATCTAAAYGKISLAVLREGRADSTTAGVEPSELEAVAGRRYAQDQQRCSRELARAREKLDGLVRELRASTASSKALAPSASSIACSSTRAARWSSSASSAAPSCSGASAASARAAPTQLRAARGRVDAFEKRVGEIEERRAGAASRRSSGSSDAHRRARGRASVEAQEEEEQRSHEWIDRARDRRAAASRAGHALDARRRGRRALPQVARHGARCSRCC